MVAPTWQEIGEAACILGAVVGGVVLVVMVAAIIGHAVTGGACFRGADAVGEDATIACAMASTKPLAQFLVLTVAAVLAIVGWRRLLGCGECDR